MSESAKKCKQHPKYKAIFKPRGTEKHPDGCLTCWGIYHDLSAERAAAEYEAFMGPLEGLSK